MNPNECLGGCGLVMSGPDMWCVYCWPKDETIEAERVRLGAVVRRMRSKGMEVQSYFEPKDAA